MPERRDILKTVGAAASLALAGCPASSDEDGTDATATGTATSTETVTATATATPEDESDEGTDQPSVAPAKMAVATELNVYRTRLFDAVALGRAGAPGAAATVAGNVFGRFEGATGEYGAHEMLESASESAYEGFEEALGSLRSTLDEGDVEAAADHAREGAEQLRIAQAAMVGEANSGTLDMLFYGTRAVTAEVLASTGNLEAANTVATETLEDFEDAVVHGTLETEAGDTYGQFEGALGSVASASSAATARKQARAVLDAAVEGAYALGPESLAAAGHISTYQARGWDGAAATHLGGPGTDYAHAAALNIYRARTYDAHWLATRGETDTAATMAGDIFAHFEGARAHEALEEADTEAYEGFETGLGNLRSAIENGNSAGIDSAVETVDSNLVAGIEALAGGDAPLLQSAFFRARFADARELARQDKYGRAQAIAEGLFQRFEANELDFHETLEDTSEDLYRRFEEQHLTALIEAYDTSDGSAIDTHHEGVMQALLDFEAEHSAALASGAEAGYMDARGFDAAALDALGKSSRAQSIAQSTFQHFESGAAGYHETLEEADSETYETFESALGAVRSAAANGQPVYPEAKAFDEQAVASAYDIVAAAGSADVGAAVLSDVFASFEQARVHDVLEEADTAAYEGFEAALGDYQSALSSGSAEGVTRFANATRTAQFAVAGAPNKAPAADTASGSDEEGDEPHLQGGPNVVEGVPDDADHVVDMKAVAFEPVELAVKTGEKVAWTHAGGEPHSVSAYEEKLPDGADYWASGGFDSEQAAREGWENGKGAIQSGQSYVHTFETTGEHAYFCIPHEMAGMKGTVVVEE